MEEVLNIALLDEKVKKAKKFEVEKK